MTATGLGDRVHLADPAIEEYGAEIARGPEVHGTKAGLKACRADLTVNLRRLADLCRGALSGGSGE